MNPAERGPFCIRCEERIPASEDRFFRAVLVGGVQRFLEFFCRPCFDIWAPADVAARVR